MTDMGTSELAAATAAVTVTDGFTFPFESIEGTLTTIATAGAAWLIRWIVSLLKRKLTK